ncbi:MAG: methionyl-tRNA formyltransferase [Dehalococcoidia bacterium]
MRVSVMGQAAFGEAVFKRLLDDGVEIAGVSAPPSEGRPDALWAAAAEAGFTPIPTASLREDEGLNAWRGLEADLCVMAFVTDILPIEAFAIPYLGTIQYHPSLLPAHRGASAINWAIINGDEETGITIFWPDEGLDTGPVLLERAVPIGADDTVGSLYFNQLFPMGVEAISEAVRLVVAGEAPRDVQEHTLATHEPPCREKHAEIRWFAPARQVYALIRGCNPQPGAWTTFRGEKVKVFDSTFSIQGEAGLPGQVLSVDERGVRVRLNGGTLTIGRVQPDGGKKQAAVEWAATVGLEAGQRLR